MGHEDGSVQARYSHVTAEMRRRLMTELTMVWEDAFDARRLLRPTSPVSLLNRLLGEREPGQAHGDLGLEVADR